VKFEATEVKGCFIVEPEPHGDQRGFFARIFDAAVFRDNGLASSFVQFNNSLSAEAGTLRGLHYQIAPAGEEKLVRCVAGAVFDVVVDLRQHSPTFGLWTGVEISTENRRLLYAPKGCAHGFLTLSPATELIYFASAPYSAAHERGLRWNDPRFSIRWPTEPAILSDKDRDARDYDPGWHASGY
jgi:dTDP-4-dehydrorhamnose 3,5-epimerase